MRRGFRPAKLGSPRLRLDATVRIVMLVSNMSDKCPIDG